LAFAVFVILEAALTLSMGTADAEPATMTQLAKLSSAASSK
jgi:hypothetical protein